MIIYVFICTLFVPLNRNILKDSMSYFLHRKVKKSPAKAGPKMLNVYSIIDYASLTFTAFNPFLPSSKSNVTSSFSLTLSLSPFACTKYSFGEFESLIKPNPFDSLKNLTVPVFMM